jgi:RNA polymerase subunit RPABC4/transcription elongation factor Spt4
MDCSKCGAQIADNAKFCPLCGKKTEKPASKAKTPIPPPPMIDCSKCGENIAARTQFCPFCGEIPPGKSKPTVQADYDPAPKLQSCAKCGEDIAAKAKFCPLCGTALGVNEKESAPKAATVEPASAPAPAPVPTPQAAPVASVSSGSAAIQAENWRFGGGAIFWFILCAIGGFAGFGMNLLLAPLSAVFALITAIFYILLMTKKRRSAFIVILILAIINIVLNAIFGLGAWAIFGIIAPLISFLILRKYWARMQ